ncbi:MAG TPA: bifunctional phosphopantothenoylcysteine decarboxylase/phosphopantothenate--cysteine ligase CoaBC [Candidatus Limnocylindria bacterium]|nr:bifunctional phosphopantothenoylcysteine decarboxylase/phosphopantothenate--cysteine ligase CoaBC [Candidatus Limnocylindria bacterium]
MTTAPRRLEGRLIGLGVTASIAAYKAVELLRLLAAEGADVVVMLSPSATRFVGPLSFAALSRHPVETDVLDLLPDGRIGHIVIADSADALVVAPATAHWLAAMANGLSGDVVTAAALATSAPVVVAPAMDGDMWTHQATVANVARLRDVFGYAVVPPESGPLASGQVGVGRLAELPAIVDAVVDALADRPVRQPGVDARPPVVEGPPREADLTGRRIVITAGGTREPIDPVRYIGNRSTGKMGVALAEAALARGAAVTLIAAAVEVPLPKASKQVDVVRVETASDLGGRLLSAMDPVSGPPPDALVMAAAVADFTPVSPADQKITRRDGLTLELAPTSDLLAMIATIVEAKEESPPYEPNSPTGGWPRPILVGFAAETGSLDRAPAKLAAKGVDLLVANDVSEPGSGFGTDTNRVIILDRGGAVDELPLLSKREVADRILDRVARALDARDAAAQTSTEQPARAREGQST